MADRTAALAQLHAILACDSPSSTEHASRQREALSLEAPSDDSHESSHSATSSGLARVSRSPLLSQQPATSRTHSLPAHASAHIASAHSLTLARAATSSLGTFANTLLPVPADANTEAASSDGAHKPPALENKRRCAGLTRLKTQCSRYSDSEYCYQHAGTVETSAPRQAEHSALHEYPSSSAHPITASSTSASLPALAPALYASAAVSILSGGLELPDDHHSEFALRVSGAIADDELFLSREFGHRFDSNTFDSAPDYIAPTTASNPVRGHDRVEDETLASGHNDVGDDDDGLDAHGSVGVAQELVLQDDDDSFIHAEELEDFDDYDGDDNAWRDPSPHNDLGFDAGPQVDEGAESRSDSLHPRTDANSSAGAGAMLIGAVSSEYQCSGQVERTGSQHIHNSHDINEHLFASSFPAFPSFANFSAHSDSNGGANAHLHQETVPQRKPLSSFVIDSSSSARRPDDPAVSHSDVSSLLSHISELSRLTSGDPRSAPTNPQSSALESLSFATAAAADLYSASAFGASGDHRPSPSRRRISLPRLRASPVSHRSQTPTLFSSTSAAGANDDDSVPFTHSGGGGGMSIVKGANYLHVSHTNHASSAVSSTALPVASDSALFYSAPSSHSGSPLPSTQLYTSDSPPSPTGSPLSSAPDHAFAALRRLPLLRASLAHWRTLLVRRRHHERLAAQLGDANATIGALRAWRAALERRIRIKVRNACIVG